MVDWPTPVSVYEVRSFLGLDNSFRKYIRVFSAMAAPLTDLLKGIPNQGQKGNLLRWGRLLPAEVARLTDKFSRTWTAACATSFAALKTALTSAPVLVLPDMSKQFELAADACECQPAVGAVLLQSGRPVSYYSRKLSGPEQGYSASDIEMLAVVSALREWRCCLDGPTAFKIVTDHEPNTYLDTATNPHTEKRRARWLDASCGYNCSWEYRVGRGNVAHSVSRAPQHFNLMCMCTALVHSLTPRRREREMGDSGPGASRAAVMCCHVCTGGSCNMARQLRSRLVPDAPNPLPPPPPLSRSQREKRKRSVARGGGGGGG